MLPGINLTLKIGPNNPKPAKRELIEALDSVEVMHNDQKRSGFQLVFAVGRSCKQDQSDYKLLRSPLLTPFNRVIIIITFGAKPRILMDGMITNQQLAVSGKPGESTLTVTGEDVSIMMDLAEKSVEHPQQDEATIVGSLISQSEYSNYNLKPEIKSPSFRDRPTDKERIPVQQGTDLKYIQQLAERFAFVFYTEPGPKSGENIAYWGPPRQGTKIQKALTMNMGSFTNLNSLSFENNALAVTTVEGRVQGRNKNAPKNVEQESSDRLKLAKQPALSAQTYKIITQFRETGLSLPQAYSRAQAMVNRSEDDVVTATGELNSVRYGDILAIRERVGLRGVGYGYDGLYYVKSVNHKIRPGEYKQSFTITREGLGTTVQRVKV